MHRLLVLLMFELSGDVYAYTPARGDVGRSG